MQSADTSPWFVAALLAVIFCISAFVAGCGGGGGTSTREQPIITPPEYSEYFYCQGNYQDALPNDIYGRTIAQAGCALTCTAMLITYTGTEMSPPQLMNVLGPTAFNSYGQIKWSYAGNATQGRVRFIGPSSPDWASIDKSLVNGLPVIVHYIIPESPCGHWILIAAKVDGHYIINDPGQQNGAGIGIESSWAWTSGASPQDLVDLMVLAKVSSW
ncbi:MAG: C39 family peptidase [Armatimonadota bacterium]|nr:C39 family peptidase [bacterium]